VLAPISDHFAGEPLLLSPDGPTRARMALIATCALLIAAPLGALGPSFRLSHTPWRVLRAHLAWWWSCSATSASGPRSPLTITGGGNRVASRN